MPHGGWVGVGVILLLGACGGDGSRAPFGDGADSRAELDGSVTDAADDLSTAGADLSATDAPAFDTGLQSCAKHVDCKQGRFCYYGKCLLDGEQPVYHCGKSGCPPGQWCVDQAGQRGVCAESNVYVCADACDCGPAHCCKGGVCVKDVADPWSPGGTAINGLSCERGKDATYCCESPVCHVAQQAYGILVGSFRC